MTGREGSPLFIGGTVSLNGSGTSRERGREHGREIGRELSQNMAVDAVRNGWERDREPGLGTTTKERKMIQCDIGQLLKRNLGGYF